MPSQKDWGFFSYFGTKTQQQLKSFEWVNKEIRIRFIQKKMGGGEEMAEHPDKMKRFKVLSFSMGKLNKCVTRGTAEYCLISMCTSKGAQGMQLKTETYSLCQMAVLLHDYWARFLSFFFFFGPHFCCCCIFLSSIPFLFILTAFSTCYPMGSRGQCNCFETKKKYFWS